MKKIIKTLLLLIIATTLFLTLFVIDYNHNYSITNNKDSIESSILSYFNNPIKQYSSVTIEDMKDIYNKKYLLCNIDNNLSSLVLTKGSNKKYKIDSSSIGNSFYTYEIDDSDNEHTLVLFIHNTNNQLSEVKIEINNEYITKSIPDEEYSIITLPINEYVKKDYNLELNLDFEFL